MYKTFKHTIYRLIPALLLLLSFPFLSGGAPKNSAFSVASEYIVLWEDSISSEEAELRLADFGPEFRLTEHEGTLSIFRDLSGEASASLLDRLNQIPSVRVAEENQSTALCASLNEMQYGDSQWALHNTGAYTYYIKDLPIHRSSTSDIDINLPEAYEMLQPDSFTRTVTVAIIDTGVDIYHPALTQHIWVNEKEIPDNGKDDDKNGYIDDCYGWDFYNDDNTVCHYDTTLSGERTASASDNDNHGTHCAGIIASSEGILGVAAGIDVRILPLKIHGGEKNSGSVANAIKAVKYAQAAGADICNMSWGTTVYSEALETTMRESGMLFVVAAGNSGGNNNSTPLYPASYSLDNMISVAYVTQFGELAEDSNYGLSTVDIAAPGEGILSTTVGNEYHYLSGSSMAAPIVSGISALLYAYNDSLYPQNVKEIILQTLKPLDSLIGYIRYPGIVDAAAALASADLLSTDRIAPTLSATTEYQESFLTIHLETEDLGGSGIRTLRYAAGIHNAAYFRGGTLGQSMTDPDLFLGKSGTYTFYISDYAGNENVLVYSVEDDVLAPALSVSSFENTDGTFTVTVSAEDDASGIKYLRYFVGDRTEHFFYTTAQNIPPEENLTFIATEGAIFTIQTSDYRGNKTSSVFEVTRIPAEKLFLNTAERSLHVNETFRLVPLILPFHTTDYISYSVSDETLLYAAPDGTLTALSPGTVTVTVTASGGLSRSCTIHITEQGNEMLPPLPTEPRQHFYISDSFITRPEKLPAYSG